MASDGIEQEINRSTSIFPFALAYQHAETALNKREVQLLRAELEKTNQGLVALYIELDERAEALKQATDLKSRFLSYIAMNSG